MRKYLEAYISNQYIGLTYNIACFQPYFLKDHNCKAQ